eukprot:jgi/Botrbrau1/5636/Bobra.55_1s0025.1
MHTVWGFADPSTLHAKLSGRPRGSAIEHSALSTERGRKLNLCLRCMSLPRSEDAPWSVSPYYTKKLERRTDAQGNMASDNAVGDPIANINLELREDNQILTEKERLAILGAWLHMRKSDHPENQEAVGGSDISSAAGRATPLSLADLQRKAVELRCLLPGSLRVGWSSGALLKAIHRVDDIAVRLIALRQVIPADVDLHELVLAEPALLNASDSEIQPFVEGLSRLRDFVSGDSVCAMLPRYNPRGELSSAEAAAKFEAIINRASALASMLPAGFDVGKFFRTCPEALSVPDDYFQASLEEVFGHLGGPTEAGPVLSAVPELWDISTFRECLSIMAAYTMDPLGTLKKDPTFAFKVIPLKRQSRGDRDAEYLP